MYILKKNINKKIRLFIQHLQFSCIITTFMQASFIHAEKKISDALKQY